MGNPVSLTARAVLSKTGEQPCSTRGATKSASKNEREKVHFVTGEHDLVEVTGTRSPVSLIAILWLITRRIPDQWELTAQSVSVSGCEITRRIPDQWELITRFVSFSMCEKEKTIAALQDHDRRRCYLLRGMISCYLWSQISLVSKNFAISPGTGCGVATENGFPFLISRRMKSITWILSRR